MRKNILFILGLLFLSNVLIAQTPTTTENYVLSTTYKIPVQQGQTSTVGNTDKIINIQYFDGLGRAKQNVAINAGGKEYANNEIPYDWSTGTPSNSGFYILNGSSLENQIISGTTPFGDNDLLWECVNDAANDGDGGWNTNLFDIDDTKAYRYSVWVKKSGNLSDGTTYHGVINVDYLDGTPNSNPYFAYGQLPQLDVWYLMVGYVYPSNYSGNGEGISGIYDINGNKVLNGVDFKWKPAAARTYFRSYLYYATNTNTRQYFWSPLVQKIDGTETSINDLVSSATTVFNNEIFQAKDIVTHYEYDEFGRQVKSYLPYASTSNNGAFRTGDTDLATKTFYKNKYPDDFLNTITSDVNSYSQKGFDNSPLNRVVEQTAPGKAWQMGTSFAAKGYSNNSNSIKMEYDTNTASEVKLYTVGTTFANNTYTPTLNGGTSSYNEGELSKTITKDENWQSAQTFIKDHTTEEFKNQRGQVVLKRTYNNGTAHDTYYVYDDFGNLTYVLPPKAEADTDKPNTTELVELCYQYIYDHRNRLVEKKIPGKGWEYIAYDKLDRPVLTQDAIQKTQNKWLFTKYDQLGRVIYTGVHTNASQTSRIAMQSHLDATNNIASEYYETKVTSGTGFNSAYYTNSDFPSSNIEVLTVNYYDNYIFDRAGTGTSVVSYGGVTSTSRTKGLVTGSSVKILNNSPEKWITTVTYYDEKARPIYIYSRNSYLEVTDIVESKLDDFTGKVLETKTTHKKTGNTDIITVNRFEYDHHDRLISQTEKINSQVSERIVRNNYDNIGQLVSKIVGNGTKDGYKDVTSGISISNDVITKTGSSGWNHGLATQGTIQEDGYVEFISSSINKHLMVGLSNVNSNANYNTIKYAIYPTTNNRLYIYELGVSKGQFGTYQIGDVFKVERIGNTIYYKKNNTTFYTSLITSSGVLLGDISIHTMGTQIKDLKIVDNSRGLQKVDYNYNVRGWLKNINQDSDDDNDLFNFTLNYNSPTNGTALYNGNISQTSWNTLNVDSSIKTYTYSYDALNRITAGISANSNYNLNSVAYDKNGNITNLSRNGHLNIGATSFGLMDNLTYSYDSGNKLLKIADAAPIDGFGFKDDAVNTTADTSNDYTYDANGNMLTDTNKGITSNILYNHLSLPTQINVGGQVINYTYDATGVKLQKVSNGTTTQYAGNYRYVNNTLQDFKHAEGYVKNDNGTFNYVYSYLDHLGNVRLNYADLNNDGSITTNEILDEKNFYPFGGTHEGYNTAVNGAYYPFGYNGKEENDENGLATLDFSARNYDKWTGRWMNIDPLTELMFTQSPYNYAFNNPVYFIDPDGLSPSGATYFTGYYDDGHGNVVFDPNVNNQSDVDALGIDGATYISDVYYDNSTGTYYDENGVAHENMEFNWQSMSYQWSLSRWFSNLSFEGNAIDHIGSGFVLIGEGNGGVKSNNVSDNPEDDVEIPAEVVAALRGITAKYKGPGKTIIKSIKNGLKDTKEVERLVNEGGKAKDREGVYSDTTLSTNNYTIKDTRMFTLHFWKDSVPHGAAMAQGKKGAKEKAKKIKKDYKLDSVQVIEKN